MNNSHQPGGDGFAGLFDVAVLLMDDGQNMDAHHVALQAFRVAQSDDQKRQAARLTAALYMQTESYIRAQLWLRRAAQHANTSQNMATIRRDFQTVQARNPFSADATLSIAPSNNINNGATQDYFMLEGLPFKFALPPRSLALAGMEYSGDMTLSYRLSQDARQTTRVGAYLYGRTYTLSKKSQSTVPDIAGHDYALTVAELSLTHRRQLFARWGGTGFAAHIGKMWYSDAPLANYHKIAVSQDVPIGSNSTGTISATAQFQNGLRQDEPDKQIYDIVFGHTINFSNSDALQTSFTMQLNDAGYEQTFTDQQLSATYMPARAFWGMAVVTSVGAGIITYDDFALALHGRQDQYVTLIGEAVFEDITAYGFSPQMTFTAKQTESNVTQFSTSQLSVNFGIQSNF